MQRYNINWTSKALVNQMRKGAVNFDNAVQRSLVWDINKKSLLIHSMLYGYAIPAMYFTKESGIYDSLDGKQRSNTIFEFMNDEFALGDITPDAYDDDGNPDNFSGMTYSQLPEWAKDRIKDYNLTIYYYEDMTEDEAREFFRRLNNGKPLTAMEMTRVDTPCLKDFQELSRHSAIVSVVSAAGKRRFTDEQIAMQIYHLAVAENPDFSTKTFREWAKSIQVDRDVLDTIKKGLDAYNAFVASLTDADKKVAKTVKTRTHFISCAYLCYLAVSENISQDAINETLRNFFSGKPSISDVYNNTISAGSAKPTAVTTRRNVIRSLVENLPVQEDNESAEDMEDIEDNSDVAAAETFEASAECCQDTEENSIDSNSDDAITAENTNSAEQDDDAEDDFSDIDITALKAVLESDQPSPFVQQVMFDVENLAEQDNDCFDGEDELSLF